MMKKLKWFLFVAVLLAAPAMQAQLRFGVKGGVNIASVKFNRGRCRGGVQSERIRIE